MNGPVALPLDEVELSFEATGGSLVRRTVLPTGVRILSESMPGARSATVGFWVAVGSRDEGDGDRGSTHFLEHLLFKGTPTRSALDIAVAFESVGGEHNAATGKESTCYYARVRDVDLDDAVDSLADMVTSSVLDPLEFETERGVILDELAMADDDPSDVGGERLFESVFGDHSLGRPIGGSPDSIRRASRDEVHRHYLRTYRPRDLVVTVAGAVDHDHLVERLQAAIGRSDWSTDTAPPVPRRPATGAETAPQQGEPLVIVRRPLEQTTLLLGFPGLAVTDDRRSAMAVLNSVLGGGMSSRLFQEVRERRGLAYSVYSFAPSYSDAGLFGLYAGCAPANAGDVARLMLEQLDEVATDGITADEHRRALGQLGGAAALALEDSDTRMNRLGRAELSMGEFVDLDASLARLAAVPTDDVRDLAAALRSGPLSTVVVGEVDETTLPTRAATVPTSSAIR